MTDAGSSMEFTGERFTPECVREIWYEHWHRYVFARTFARGKRVLDAACGEGYGSALLADVASSVVGVDISATAVSHAKARYSAKTNLRFEAGDCTRLQFSENTFDTIVSFETLEHVDAQNELIAGFSRSLSADGTLIISSPDKKTYSDDRGFSNEFHVRELYRAELIDLLKPHFPYVHLYGQKLLFQSAIWNLERTPATVTAATASSVNEKAPGDGLDYAPLYFIAICSRQPIDAGLAELALFGDREESVYSHYNGEVRKNMAAGSRILELEQEVSRLRTEIAATARPFWRRWFPDRR